jgi:hypothetical protein
MYGTSATAGTLPGEKVEVEGSLRSTKVKSRERIIESSVTMADDDRSLE